MKCYGLGNVGSTKEAIIKAMMWAKVKLASVVLCTAVAAGVGGGVTVTRLLAAESAQNPQATAAAPAATTSAPGAVDLDNLPEVIFEPGIEDWVVDRFAGNTTAGSWFYQGPALEVGGLQKPGRCVEGGDGTIYLITSIPGAVVPRLMQVTPDGSLHLFMEDRGLLEGPIEACQAGVPIWNPREKALYLTGPNCLRKVVEKPDGSLWVEAVAGIPNKPPPRPAYGKPYKPQDGPAKEATFKSTCRGVVCNSKGTFYWLEDHILRRIENGTVSSIPLKRTDGSKSLFVMIYGGTGLSLGENDDTLYISDFYNVQVGWGVLKCDVKTGMLTRICGTDRRNDKKNKRWRDENDGPALTHAGGRCGMKGLYHPFYNALWVWGPDEFRFRWLRFDGDGWVRTAFAQRRKETKPLKLGLMDLLHAQGVPGEHFSLRGWGSNCINHRGIDSKGGVYIGTSTFDCSGIWRAYNKNWSAQGEKEVKR